MSWSDDHDAFVGEPTTSSVRIAVRPATLQLIVLGADGSVSDTLALSGQSLDESLAWVATALASRSGSDAQPLQLPEYEIPASSVSGGAPFAQPDAALGELRRWYANASALLSDVVANRGSSPVRIWPHHFDIATLATLASGEPDTARSIGLGMTPGDGYYAEPYLYVTPWPYPDPTNLKTIAMGHWHTDEWTGAVLPGTELLRAPDQPSLARDFLRTAFDAAARALEPA
ncbi:MAG: hypothetical protein ACE5FJ_02015 [Gemmatimonadales bacterium]